MDVEVVVGGRDNIVQYRVPLSVAVLKFLKGFSPKGRASRSEFWWALLFSVVLYRGVSALAAGSFLFVSFVLLLTVLSVTLGWRRMHDIGKPGWWCLVPVYDLLLAMLPSELNENQFGPVPNTQPIAEAPRAKKVVFGIMIVSVLTMFFCGRGKNTSADSFERYITREDESDSEVGNRVMTELLLRAAQQEQYDRYNRQMEIKRQEALRKERQRMDSIWEDQKRKQQIIDDEYQRQRAREGYHRGVPKNELYFN